MLLRFLQTAASACRYDLDILLKYLSLPYTFTELVVYLYQIRIMLLVLCD